VQNAPGFVEILRPKHSLSLLECMAWTTGLEPATSAVTESGTLVYAMVLKGATMEALKVGMREFRDKLATYLLESESPVAITRHGDTVGYFIPAHRRRTDADRTALREASVRWQEVLDAEGISEEEAVAEFKRVGRNKRDDRPEARRA
jgi:PHD/YefM family antitoxin component YafN of YafNO toxin-antitoxin module